MIRIGELIGDPPTQFWRVLKQVGVAHVGSFLPRSARMVDAPWSYASLFPMKQRYHEAGFELSVIEESSPMENIRLGRAGRDEEIENFCTLLRAMGALGIPVLSYHYMAVLGFQRTSITTPVRGGAMSSRYEDAVMRELPPTDVGEVSEDQLWSSYEYFLQRVLPVAEEAKVRLALHPDDPPHSPVRGIARIFASVDGFERALGMADSPYHGVTLCQGNFALMTDDLPGLIREWGSRGKIFFVHFRDVRGHSGDFVETFHDDGPTNMYECMRAYHEIGFDGVMRSDHVPVMEGEPVTAPSYSDAGRLFAIGYQIGLREAVESSGAWEGSVPTDGRAQAQAWVEGHAGSAETR